MIRGASTVSPSANSGHQLECCFARAQQGLLIRDALIFFLGSIYRPKTWATGFVSVSQKKRTVWRKDINFGQPALAMLVRTAKKSANQIRTSCPASRRLVKAGPFLPYRRKQVTLSPNIRDADNFVCKRRRQFQQPDGLATSESKSDECLETGGGTVPPEFWGNILKPRGQWRWGALSRSD